MGVCYNTDTELAAATVALVAQAPADQDLQLSLRVVNRGAAPLTVRIFRAVSATPADWRGVHEWDARVLPGVPLVGGPFGLPAGQKLYVRPSAGDCNCVVTGQRLSAE